MAALASSLIRQKREVRDAPPARPISAQRKVCPRGTKSLCQKQLLVLISKVRLCGGRKGRLEKSPGEYSLALGPRWTQWALGGGPVGLPGGVGRLSVYWRSAWMDQYGPVLGTTGSVDVGWEVYGALGGSLDQYGLVLGTMGPVEGGWGCMGAYLLAGAQHGPVLGTTGPVEGGVWGPLCSLRASMDQSWALGTQLWGRLRVYGPARGSMRCLWSLESLSLGASMD